MTDEKIMATIKPDGEYWQPEIEKMPREQLEALQVKKLKESIKVALNSPFYKKRDSLHHEAGSARQLSLWPCRQKLG